MKISILAGVLFFSNAAYTEELAKPFCVAEVPSAIFKGVGTIEDIPAAKIWKKRYPEEISILGQSKLLVTQSIIDGRIVSNWKANLNLQEGEHQASMSFEGTSNDELQQGSEVVLTGRGDTPGKNQSAIFNYLIVVVDKIEKPCNSSGGVFKVSGLEVSQRKIDLMKTQPFSFGKTLFTMRFTWGKAFPSLDEVTSMLPEVSQYLSALKFARTSEDPFRLGFGSYSVNTSFRNKDRMDEGAAYTTYIAAENGADPKHEFKEYALLSYSAAYGVRMTPSAEESNKVRFFTGGLTPSAEYYMPGYLDFVGGQIFIEAEQEHDFRARVKKVQRIKGGIIYVTDALPFVRL